MRAVRTYTTLLLLTIGGCSQLPDDPPAQGGGGSSTTGGGAGAPAGSGGAGNATPQGGQAGASNAGTSSGGVSGTAGSGGIGGSAAIGGTSGAAGTGGAGATSGQSGSGGSAAGPPDGPGVCGDGWRPPQSSEQCDDGDNDDSADLCYQCKTTDALGVPYSGTGNMTSRHVLGKGRHPIAASPEGLAVVYLTEQEGQPTLGMTLYQPNGVYQRGITGIELGTTVLWDSHPVVAALPDSTFVVAWTDFDGDGDGLGIAMKKIDPLAEQPATAPVVHANQTTDFSQESVDLIWDGQQLVVTWADWFDVFSGPDIRVRTFNGDLVPLTSERDVATTALVEARAALAPLWNSYAVAWRESGETEIVRTQAGTNQRELPLALPGPEDALPCIAELDDTHMLLGYTEGEGIDGGGEALRYRARLAWFGAVGEPAEGTLTIEHSNSPELSTTDPYVVRIGSSLWAAWREEGESGSSLADELWIRELLWEQGDLHWNAPAVRLPRQALHREGDQLSPALAAAPYWPNGAIWAAWADLGGIWTEPPVPIHEQVVLTLLPLPLGGQ